VSTATVPLRQRITPADREVALAVINRVLPTYAQGMHAATDAVLRHEAERLEGVESTPVVKSMRAIVEGERLMRRGGAR
jgi:hypothetical protein